MDPLLTAALALAAVIHLVPLAGVAGPAALRRLYGVTPAGPVDAVLLQHRAVLFGLLGAGLVAAVWDAGLRPWAIGATLVSDVAFLLIALPRLRALDGPMRGVVRSDVLAVGALLVAISAS